MVNIEIDLSDDELDRLEALAEASGWSAGEVLAQLIDNAAVVDGVIRTHVGARDV